MYSEWIARTVAEAKLKENFTAHHVYRAELLAVEDTDLIAMGVGAEVLLSDRHLRATSLYWNPLVSHHCIYCALNHCMFTALAVTALSITALAVTGYSPRSQSLGTHCAFKHCAVTALSNTG